MGASMTGLLNLRASLVVSALVFSALALPVAPASAAITLEGVWGADSDFEGPGGYLNSTLGLPIVSGSALIPLERAVGEVRIGNPERTRALHMPTAATGLPVADGGTGVTQALTSVSPIGSATTAWDKLVAVPFELKREGNAITYTVGSFVATSDELDSVGDINAFVLRLRATPDAGQVILYEVLYSDEITPGQFLGTLNVYGPGSYIQLWSGIVGDFRLTGSYAFDWAGDDRPMRSAINSQFKLIELPNGVIPEPGTWAMLIAGFGAVGIAARRRRAVRAA